MCDQRAGWCITAEQPHFASSLSECTVSGLSPISANAVFPQLIFKILVCYMIGQMNGSQWNVPRCDMSKLVCVCVCV